MCVVHYFQSVSNSYLQCFHDIEKNMGSCCNRKALFQKPGVSDVSAANM